jgi:hypothetical protein
MERQRRNKEENEQKDVENERRAKAHKEVRDSIIEYNPKMDCKVFTRFFLRDFSVFDIDEKCKYYISSFISLNERYHINECVYPVVFLHDCFVLADIVVMQYEWKLNLQ